MIGSFAAAACLVRMNAIALAAALFQSAFDKTQRPTAVRLGAAEQLKYRNGFEIDDQASSCSPAVAVLTAVSQRANMPGSCLSGSEASDWTRGYLGRIHCDEQKPP